MNNKKIDFSFLDRPEISAVLFYPRRSYYVKPFKPNVRDQFIEVEKGIKIGCRFYVRGLDCPSLLYFHGNGEIVEDYDWSAPFYNEIGLNLFVADYRGYGFSNGRPTIANMIKDSQHIFKELRRTVEEYDLKKKIFVMGRSLGSIPAIEVAYRHQDAIHGLIIESGSAYNFRHFFDPLISNHPVWSDESSFLNKVKLQSIFKPTLIIHADRDSLVPIEEGKELFQNAAARDKQLIIIPSANHNNLMLVGKEQYFKTIRKFVETH